MYEIHDKHLQFNICKDDYENIIYFICYNNKIRKRYLHKFVFDTQKECENTLNILLNMMSKTNNYTYNKKYNNNNLVIEFNRKINDKSKIIMKGVYMSLEEKNSSIIYFKLQDEYDFISVKKIGNKYSYYVRRNEYKHIIIVDKTKFNFSQVKCKKFRFNAYQLYFGEFPKYIDNLIVDYSFNNNITEYKPSLVLQTKLLGIHVNNLEFCNVNYDFNNQQNIDYIINLINKQNIDNLIISCDIHLQFFEYIEFIKHINLMCEKDIIKLYENNHEPQINIKNENNEIDESNELDEITKIILDNIEVIETLVV